MQSRNAPCCLLCTREPAGRTHHSSHGHMESGLKKHYPTLSRQRYTKTSRFRSGTIKGLACEYPRCTADVQSKYKIKRLGKVGTDPPFEAHSQRYRSPIALLGRPGDIPDEMRTAEVESTLKKAARLLCESTSKSAVSTSAEQFCRAARLLSGALVVLTLDSVEFDK